MKKSSLLASFHKNPLINTILLIVISLHFFFLLILLISPKFALKKKQHQSLIVKTVVSKPFAKTATHEKKDPHQNTVSASTPSFQSAQKTTQTPKVQTQPRKEQTSKAQTPKQISSKKKEPAIADKQLSKAKQPTAKKNLPSQNRAKISDSLLKELEESISKIENKSDKEIAGKTIPPRDKALAPVSLQIDTPSYEFSNETKGSSDYTDVLVSHLHQSLRLPDYGEVKIQLSLRQDGTVCRIIVLKAQSEKNKQYLESRLPQLKFPPFDGAYVNKKEYTFILTFCNELG
jgi:hypothetical protein